MTSSRSFLRRLGLTAVLLISAMALTACPSRSEGTAFEDDRPVIIISSGSVDLAVKNQKWTKRGGKDYDQDVPKGKSVKSFTAETVLTTADAYTGPAQCTISGSSLMVLYGSRLIVLTTKDDKINNGNKAANVQFPGDATVTLGNGGSTVSVTTTDTLSSVWNETGDSCPLAGMRIRVVQKHQ